jgi:hypothetical protein
MFQFRWQVAGGKDEDFPFAETDMKLSQNLLSKADTYVKPVAESGISGLVHVFLSPVWEQAFSTTNTPLLVLE